MRTSSDLLAVVFFLPLVTIALAGSEPFRFQTDREGSQVRSSARVGWQGTESVLETRRGEAASRGLLMQDTTSTCAGVLWLEATSGKQGRVAVYSVPSAKLLTQTGWFERPAMEASGTGGFQVTTPMRKLDLAPPWLRMAHRFQVSGGQLIFAGKTKGQPETPSQSLEWAADETANGDALRALQVLEAVLRDPVREPEETGLTLHLIAMAQKKLGRGPDLVSTLNALVRAHATEPAGQSAREALAFIEKNGLPAYLSREEQ